MIMAFYNSDICGIEHAFHDWENHIQPKVVAHCGEDDRPALAESWSSFTDSLVKNGEMTELQYHYCPAHDDNMPEEDEEVEWLVRRMGVNMKREYILERTDGTRWPDTHTHWSIELSRFKMFMRCQFSDGGFWDGDMLDVIWSLLFEESDLAYEDWADELGYDRRTDYRPTYNAMLRNSKSLRDLFSDSEREQLRALLRDY
jgi:hypothetical protein